MRASKRVVLGLWLALTAVGAVIASLAVAAYASAAAASELVEFYYSIQGTFPPGAVFSAHYRRGVNRSAGSQTFASFVAIAGSRVEGDGASLYSSVY